MHDINAAADAPEVCFRANKGDGVQGPVMADSVEKLVRQVPLGITSKTRPLRTAQVQRSPLG
jgi:hypothetical protein